MYNNCVCAEKEKRVKILRTTIVITLLAVMTFALSGCTTWDNFKAAFIDKQDPDTKIQICVL